MGAVTKVIGVALGLAVIGAVVEKYDKRKSDGAATGESTPEAAASRSALPTDTCGTLGKWEICVTGVKRQKRVSNGFSGYTAGDGSVYFLVQIQVSHSAKSEARTWDLDFAIGDADGNLYSPDDDGTTTAMMSRLDTCGVLGDQVNPKQAQRCWLVFYLTKGTPGIHLVVRDGGKRLRLNLGE